MNIRAGLLTFLFAMELCVNSYAELQLTPPPEPQPDPRRPLCCWVFVPTPPELPAVPSTFKGKILKVNLPDSTLEVEIEAPQVHRYVLKEMGGEQGKLLLRLKSGDWIKATFNEPMRMYHLDKLEKAE